MNEEIVKRAQLVFRKVFHNPALLIRVDQAAGDIPGWDSLTHMTLIAELEAAFSIVFTFQEVSAFANVGDIILTISKKHKINPI